MPLRMKMQVRVKMRRQKKKKTEVWNLGRALLTGAHTSGKYVLLYQRTGSYAGPDISKAP